jgi:5-deoxy-D-glucuronate isomerase
MQIDIFYNYKEAIESFAEPDREYDFVVHKLDAGEEIEMHSHDQEEWIIIDEGRVEITSLKDGHAQTHTLQSYDENSEIPHDKLFLLHISPKEKHSLKALTEVSYMVYKTKAPQVMQIRGVFQG